MDDLISRQAAIDALTTECSWTFYDEHGQLTPNGEEILGTLKKIPSAQQWIPCSEMLPRDKGVYLVTDDSGGVAWVEKAWFMWRDDGRPFWEYANVTAWMRLPEPYKGESGADMRGEDDG